MFLTPILMGRRKTSYLDPPPPPPNTKPESLLRKYLTKGFTGKHGHFRFLILTWSASFVVSVGILLDAFVIRPEKYPSKSNKKYVTNYNESPSALEIFYQLKGRFERDPWWLGMWGDVEAMREEMFKREGMPGGEKSSK